MMLVEQGEAGPRGMVEFGGRDAVVEVIVSRHDRLRDRDQAEPCHDARRDFGHDLAFVAGDFVRRDLAVMVGVERGEEATEIGLSIRSLAYEMS